MSEELKINMPLFNINEEAELENNLSFHLDEFTNEIMRTMTRDKEIEILKKVIKKQQAKIKELEKGNRSLMESRIKWKSRYYKEKAKNKDYINKDKIRERIKNIEDTYKKEMKPYQTEFGLNVSLLSKKEKEELINKRNGLLTQKITLEELLEGN